MDNYSMNDYSLNDITLVDKKYYSELKRKAKAFDEINKILDVYLGNVEDELNALNLIREKLEDLEDE